MEGLFDNILYIVIMIVVLALSLLNKKKKTGEAQRKTTQRPSTVFDPFEEIFTQRETDVEEEPDEEEEIIRTTPEIRSILREPVQSNEPRHEAFNPEVVSAFAQAEKMQSAKVKAEKTIEDNMIIDMKYDWDSEEEQRTEIEFDLRSAVIQSEILNRKYT